jgi:hypothetical protein
MLESENHNYILGFFMRLIESLMNRIGYRLGRAIRQGYEHHFSYRERMLPSRQGN